MSVATPISKKQIQSCWKSAVGGINVSCSMTQHSYTVAVGRNKSQC